MTQNKTMAIKARLANQIRTMLYKKYPISDAQKLEFFNQIFILNSEMHRELNNYKSNKKRKAEVQKLRLARGWKPRKKMPLEKYKKDLEKS